jgi:hypothetical protein
MSTLTYEEWRKEIGIPVEGAEIDAMRAAVRAGLIDRESLREAVSKLKHATESAFNAARRGDEIVHLTEYLECY